MTFFAIFLGFLLTMLTGLNLADAAIKESKRHISDDVHPIEKEIQFNAKIRELQGVRRVGDELTERPLTERVGVVRETRR